MANLASGLLPIEKELWTNAPEATNGNTTTYGSHDGFASAVCPNNFTLDLKKTHRVVAIRFLLWDGLGQPGASRDHRQYFYRLFTSEDEKKWEFVWGTGHEGFNGWQVFEFQQPQKARYVRLECIHNTDHQVFHIVEFEVHDEQPAKLPPERVTVVQYISEAIQPLRNKVNELVSDIEGRSKDLDTFKRNASVWSKEIEEVHTKLKEQRKAIDAVVQSFDEASNQLDLIRKDYSIVNGSAELSKGLLSSMEGTQEGVTRLKDELEQERNEVSGLIDGVKAFHTNTFIPLQNQITQLQTTATESATNAIHAAAQAEDFKNQGETALQGIQHALQQSQDRYASLEKVAEDVQKVFEKATNPVDGVQAKLDSINGIKGQIDTIAGEIRATQEIAAKHAGEVTKSKDSFDQILSDTVKLKDNITTEHTESVRLKGEIANILEIVSDTGRANSWDQRRKRSQYSAILWVAMTMVGVVISASLVDKVFFSTDFKLELQNEYVAFLLRLTLTAPGVFLAWFSAAQYSKERLFLEQYEFKTAAALAMESYTELLQRNYPDKKNETYGLTLELIRKVYAEPIYSKGALGYKGELKIPLGSGDANISIVKEQEL